MRAQGTILFSLLPGTVAEPELVELVPTAGVSSGTAASAVLQVPVFPAYRAQTPAFAAANKILRQRYYNIFS